jgi:hypothetical protein
LFLLHLDHYLQLVDFVIEHGLVLGAPGRLLRFATLRRCATRRYAKRTLARANSPGSISQSAVTLHRVAAFCFHAALRFFELARVIVRFEDVASIIVSANHSIM